MKENDYLLALKHLTPELIVARLSSYSDNAIDAQIDRVSRFAKRYPKTPRHVINGILVLLLMTHKGKLPNDRYMQLTHQSFVIEHEISTPEETLDHIIRRKEYLLKKKEEKQKKRQSYYDNVINPDVSEVMDPTAAQVSETKQMLEQLSQKKRLQNQ